MLKADNSVSIRQYYFVISLVWILIFILIARYFQIQVISFDAYSKKSNTNRIRKITTNAPRGLIGSRIRFSKISVGATENALLAAFKAKGKTRRNTV